jgi:NAD(P)-dependent dehydrogenase (short-subunit alcohol dehydrogenase family)
MNKPKNTRNSDVTEKPPVLVTGSAGRIGQAVVRELKARGCGWACEGPPAATCFAAFRPAAALLSSCYSA